MNTLERRVNVRLQAEKASERRAQIAATRDHTRLMKQADMVLGQINAAVQGLKNGYAPDLHDLVAKLARITRDARLALIRAQAAALRLERLSDPVEFAERVAAAEKNGLAGKIDGPTAAKLVLLHNGQALHVNEITRQMLEAGTVRLDGRTPAQTVSSYLAKNGDVFVKVAPATYDLKERVQ